MRKADISEIFKVLSVETRLKIITLLREKPRCVSALSQELGVSITATSQHLRLMRNYDLVNSERHGYYIRYTLVEKTLKTWRREIDRILDIGKG